MWLTILRIGVGAQVVFFCLSLRNDWNDLLAPTGGGLISRKLAEAVVASESAAVPNISWLTAAGRVVGMQDATVVSLTWTLLLAMGIFLIIGFCSRPAAIAAWFLHLCAVKSGDLLAYGVDNLTTIALFYLMISPLPGLWAVDRWLWLGRAPTPELTGFFRRVLQLHLCIIYFFGGLAKSLGQGWWDGSNVWRALIRPPFNVLDPHVLVHWKWLFPVLGIGVCLLETGYPIFIWMNKTRALWLAGILLMHFAIGLLMNMYLFALIMIVLNLAAFGPGLLSIDRKANTAPSDLAVLPGDT